MLSWDKRDRDKAIWYHLRERSRCSGCGTLPEEWDEEQGGSRHAYAAVETRCRGCQVLQSGVHQMSKGPDKGRGIHVVLSPPRR